ncbi:hypothetical protein Acr_10g0009840 [Actinidia rufa]|uniref:Integrase catalytic domain-containing protein n=1 Tax=Actinidia rufa TaxID=165716 RepID=A0A7J0FBP0_9ERIC|nr:hypothetical protein Acr_10g0009840 [Actinidia rufa]
MFCYHQNQDIESTEQITLADPRKTENSKPLEEVVPISIHPDDLDHHVMIGTELTNELRFALTNFLKRNSDGFAWSQGDVPGIDPQVATHKLFTNLEYPPVRQKRRKFAPERLNKLIKTNVVQEAHYPDWLANVVVALKKGESGEYVWLSHTSTKLAQKIVFSLPKIDLIVDAMSKHKLLSFIDAFSGYHQIKMYPLDIEKTSFITEQGLYCYKVMPFGLKNAGATYQRLVNKIFKRADWKNHGDTSGRLLKWSIELSEFHIEYRPRMAIKAQTLADFVIESTHETTPEPEITLLEVETPKEQSSNKDLAWWILYVDGSSNQHGCGAGLVIQTSSGEQMEYAIRIGFKAANNEAEYETLLAGLRVAAGLQEENKKADALANLASTFDFISDRCIPLEFLTSPSIEVANLVLQVEESPTWMDETIIYLQDGALPKDKLQARRIQYRFGIPKVIISDNARQFDNDKFKLFCSDLAISHHFSSPGHPQANGQVEVTNRTILRNLKARLERSKSGWVKELPSILWAYHTKCRIPTGETPYSMVFGTESIILVEIAGAKRSLNLDLLDEKREMAELRQAAYKCWVAKYYNQKVKHRYFLPDDLVLRKVTLSTKELNVGKLGPTREGPYNIIKASKLGTYWLEDLSGKALSHPWNTEHLKKYY